MFLLTDSQFKEIAELLDCGQIVFVHRKTAEIIHHPDFDQSYGDVEEFYEKELKELESNFSDYWKVEQLTARDSFEIMANFTNQLDDSNKLKSKLVKALNYKKPFANFKFEIEYSGVYRQEWFSFKNQQLKDWVIEKYNEEKSFMERTVNEKEE